MKPMTGMLAVSLLASVFLFSVEAANAQSNLRPARQPQEPSSVPADTARQYNPYTRRIELAPEGAVPEYNPYTHRRELATPDAVPQYNPYTKKRE
jgi:hypothetical protein